MLQIRELKGGGRARFLFVAEKLSSSLWTPIWQKRFFALTKFGTLEYYKDRHDYTQGNIRLSIFLGDIRKLDMGRSSHHSTLQFEFASKKKAFRVRSRDHRGLENLQKVIKGMVGHLQVPRRPSHSLLSIPEVIPSKGGNTLRQRRRSSSRHFQRRSRGSGLSAESAGTTAKGVEPRSCVKLMLHLNSKCVENLDIKLRVGSSAKSTTSLTLPPSSGAVKKGEINGRNVSKELIARRTDSAHSSSNHSSKERVSATNFSSAATPNNSDSRLSVDGSTRLGAVAVTNINGHNTSNDSTNVPGEANHRGDRKSSNGTINPTSLPVGARGGTGAPGNDGREENVWSGDLEKVRPLVIREDSTLVLELSGGTWFGRQVIQGRDLLKNCVDGAFSVPIFDIEGTEVARACVRTWLLASEDLDSEASFLGSEVSSVAGSEVSVPRAASAALISQSAKSTPKRRATRGQSPQPQLRAVKGHGLGLVRSKIPFGITSSPSRRKPPLSQQRTRTHHWELRWCREYLGGLTPTEVVAGACVAVALCLCHEFHIHLTLWPVLFALIYKAFRNSNSTEKPKHRSPPLPRVKSNPYQLCAPRKKTKNTNEYNDAKMRRFRPRPCDLVVEEAADTQSATSSNRSFEDLSTASRTHSPGPSPVASASNLTASSTGTVAMGNGTLIRVTLLEVYKESDIRLSEVNEKDLKLTNLLDAKEADGMFPVQKKAVWCTALASAQMSIHGFPKVVRSLVLDYWHGELPTFNSYDDMSLADETHKRAIEEFQTELHQILRDMKEERKALEIAGDTLMERNTAEGKKEQRDEEGLGTSLHDDQIVWLNHVLEHLDQTCRFLVARDWNVGKAVTLIKQAIRLRNEHSLNNILYKPKPKYGLYKEVFPQYHQGYDDNGRLLHIRRIGELRVKDLLGNFTTEELRDIEISFNELAQRILSPSIKRVTGEIEWRSHAVADFKGAGIYNLLDSKFRKVFTISSSIVQTCYPENLGVCSVICAPYMFSGLWGVVKGLLTKRTQEKVKVDSRSDPSRVLLPRFNYTYDMLPEQYGGAAVNEGPHYINSELEEMVHAYMTGARDICEILPDTSNEYVCVC